MDYDPNCDVYRRSGVFSTYLKLLREKPTLAKENPKLIRTIAETCKVPVSVVYKEAGIPEPGTQCEENNKKTIHNSVVNKSNVIVPEVKVTDCVDTIRNCYQKSTNEVKTVEKDTRTAVADINVQKRTTTQAMTIPQETNTAVVIKDPNNVSKDTESKVGTVNSTQAKAIPQYINKAVATVNAGLSNVSKDTNSTISMSTINVRKTATQVNTVPLDCSVVIINIDDDSTDKIISQPTSTPLENKINECTPSESPILDTNYVAGLKNNDVPKEKDTITYNKNPQRLSKDKRSLIRKKIRDLFLLESSLTVHKAMVEVNADPTLPNFTAEVFYNLLKILKIGYNDKCITFTREVSATDALYLKEINARHAENKPLTNTNSESAVRTRKTNAANETPTSDLAANVYNQLFGLPSITDDADSDDEAEAPASDVDDPDYAPEIPQLRRAVETSDEETDDDDFIVHDSDSDAFSEFSDDSNPKDDDNNGEADSDHSSDDENVNSTKQAVFVPVDMCENESDLKADEDKVIASPQPPFDDDVIIIDEAQTKIPPKSKLTSEADPLSAFDDIPKKVVADRRLSADDVIFVDDPVVPDVISVEKPIQWNPSELALTFDHVRGMPVLVKKTAVVKTPDVEKVVPVREVTKLPVLPKKEIRINIHRPCRICMKNVPDTVDIFNPIKWSTEIVPISQIVMKYAKIKVSSRDRLPNLICKICLDNLKAAEKFTYTCEKTDRLFSRLLRKENITGWDDNLENMDGSVTLEPNSTDDKTKDIDEGLKQYILNEYFDSANNKMRDIIEAIFKDGKYKCNDCLKTKTYNKDTSITTILNSRSDSVTNELVDKPVANDNKKHLKGKKSKTWSISKKSSKNSHLFEDLPPHIEDSNSSSCSDSARPKSPIVFVLRSNKNKTNAHLTTLQDSHEPHNNSSVSKNVIASTVPQIVQPTISRTISAGADHIMSTTVPQPIIYTTSQPTYHVVPQTACSTVAQTKHITIPQSVYSNIAQNLSISSQSVCTSVPETQYNRSVFHKTIFHTSDISNGPQSAYATATQPVPQCQTVTQAIDPSASHNASLPNNVMVRIDDQNFLDGSGSLKRKQQDEIRLTSHAKKSKYVNPAPPDDDIFEISDGEDESILHAALNASSTTVQNSVGSNVVQSLNTSRHCSTMPQTNKITNFGIAYPPGHPSQIAVSQSSAIVEKPVVQYNVVQNNKRKPRSQPKSSTDLQKIKKVRKITPKQRKPPPFVQHFQNLPQTQEYAHNNTNNYSSSTQVVKPVQDPLHTPSVLPAPTLPVSALVQQLPEQYQQNYHITITPSSNYGSGGTVQMSGINNDVLVQLSDVPQLSWVDPNYCQPQQQLQTQTLESSSFGSLVDPVTGMFFVTTNASNEQSTMYLCSESSKRDQNQLMYPQLSGVTSNGIENVTNNTLTTINNNVQLLNGTLSHNQVRAENYTILDEQSGNQVESSNKTFEDVEAMLKMTLISNDVMDPTTNEDGAIRISQIESLYGQDPHAKAAKPPQSLYESQPSTAVQAPRTYSKKPTGTLKVRNISELI